MTLSRRVVYAVLVILLPWSARALFDYGGLLRDLSGLSLIERGRLGADEWRSFLERAGQVRLRDDMERARARGAPHTSAIAEGWAWVLETGGDLPADARVYLNQPNLQIYYYATCLWFPRRLDVSTRPRLIKDPETFFAAATPVNRSEWAWLRDQGYTHLVTGTDRGLGCIDLHAATTDSPPP